MPYLDPEQRRAYQRAWLARRRADWLEEHGPCIDCGSTDRLEVDHVDPSQKVSHRIWSWAPARRDAELAKCVVRCQPCHIRKTTLGGEHARGERHGAVVLTETQVLEIRRRAQAGETQRHLAAEFGIGRSQVHRIIHRQRWAYV